MGIQAIVDPIIASIVGDIGAVGTVIGTGLGELGGALGLGTAAADAGAAVAGTAAAADTAAIAGTTAAATDTGLLAAGASGMDAATAAALGTVSADSAATTGLLAAAAPGLDAAATGAGLSAADIGGSFASLAAAPLADFAGTAAGALGTGVPGSTTAATPLATTAAAPASTTGAAVGGGASTGSAAAAAAPASAAASPTTTGVLGSVDPSLIETASAPAGLSGDTAATALGTSGASTGLASANGVETAAGATTAAAGAGGGPGAASTGAGLLGSLKTWGPLALSGGGLLASMLEGSQKPAFEGQLQSQAAAMANQGAQLENYLTSGTLPPGVQSGLTQAYNSAAATIRSQYAQRGQTGSSAEMQDLANLSSTTVAQGAQIATNLLRQGVSESEFSAQLYSQLMQASMQQDAALSKSIADFSGSLAGMGLRSVG